MCFILVNSHLCGFRGAETSRENCGHANEAAALLASFSGYLPTTDQLHQLADLREQCADMTEERDVVGSDPNCEACGELERRLGGEECRRRIRASGEIGSRWAGYGR